jgi:hypothetical protein
VAGTKEIEQEITEDAERRERRGEVLGVRWSLGWGGKGFLNRRERR